MRKGTNLLLRIILVLWVSQNTWAESKGLLWQFEKNGQKSFLMGAVHFANDSFYPLSDAIMSAYDASSILLVEVDDNEVSAEQQQYLIQKHGLYRGNDTLNSRLTPKTLHLIETLLSEFGVSLSQVQGYRPGMLAITLAALQAEKLGYRATKGIDHYFLQKARYRKTIRQIETFELQMKLISRLPDDEASLQASFADMRDYKKMWNGMMAAWKKGDGEALYEQAIGRALRETPILSTFFDVLFFDRHPRMVESAEECINNKEICFIVVGAGHLVGDKGLVAELQRRGYQLKQF